MDKFAIIGGDIHKLVKIASKEDWSRYAWRIHETGSWYWIPLGNEKRGPPSVYPDCPLCQLRSRRKDS